MLSSDPLQLRLLGVAAALDLPGLGPRVEDVVSLAVDLLVAGRDTPATVAVASVGGGATLRDIGADLRAMLDEQGAAAPPPDSGAGGSTTATWALSVGVMSVGEFSGYFYRDLPAWVDQTDAQRRLVVLLDEWEHEADLSVRDSMLPRIQEAAESALAW